MQYDDIVKRDLELHWIILDYCRKTPWIEQNMAKIVSKYPWQDICLLTWIGCIVGLVEVGSSFFWIVSLNLCASFVLRKLLEAKRPLEYDRRMKPLTDTNAESFGFPSLESYMAVVISCALAPRFPYLWFYLLSGAITLLIGFSRVYTRARFPHQIAGSWVLGVLGYNVLGRVVKAHLTLGKMEKFTHHSGVGFLVLLGLAHVALNIENNDSRLMWVPKSEFVRVLGDIMNGGSLEPPPGAGAGQSQRVGAGRSGVMPGSLDGDGGYGYGARRMTPRSAAVKQAVEAEHRALLAQQQQAQQRKSRRYFDRVKHDSFYFLQRSLMSRSTKTAGGSGATSGESTARSEGSLVGDDDDDYDDGYQEYRPPPGKVRGRRDTAPRDPQQGTPRGHLSSKII